MKLVHEADVAVALFAALGRRHRAEIPAFQLHPAAGGRVQAAEQLQQRRLSGARCAHYRHAFTRLNRQVHSTQHFEHPALLTEMPRQSVAGQRRRALGG